MKVSQNYRNSPVGVFIPAILLALTPVALCANMSVSLYSTDFSNFPEGLGELIGNDGWQTDETFNPDGVTGVLDFGAADFGKMGFLGFNGPGDDQVYVWQELGYDPIAEGTPIVSIEIDLIFSPSNNGFDDFFGVQIYNDQIDILAAIGFDLADNSVTRFDGANDVTVSSFATNQALSLEMTIDYANNTWSSTLNETFLFQDETFNATGSPLDLGELDLFWGLIDSDPANHGNNFVAFDNISVSAAAVPEPSIYGLILGISAIGIAAMRRRRA